MPIWWNITPLFSLVFKFYFTELIVKVDTVLLLFWYWFIFICYFPFVLIRKASIGFIWWWMITGCWEFSVWYIWDFLFRLRYPLQIYVFSLSFSNIVFYLSGTWTTLCNKSVGWVLWCFYFIIGVNRGFLITEERRWWGNSFIILVLGLVTLHMVISRVVGHSWCLYFGYRIGLFWI